MHFPAKEVWGLLRLGFKSLRLRLPCGPERPGLFGGRSGQMEVRIGVLKSLEKTDDGNTVVSVQLARLPPHSLVAQR